MSIGIAINNALSGLKISQQSFAVLSQNIANANTEDYTRQTISQSSINIGSVFGSGVHMDSINRVADDYITKSVITRSSSVARATLISNMYDQVQLRLGQPGQSNSLDSYVNNYFNSLSKLSISPELAASKSTAVEAGTSLANYVSTLAKDLNQLRVDADNQIAESAGIVNKELQNLAALNRAIISAATTGQSTNSLRDSVDVSLGKIAEQLDITYRITDQGTVTVQTANGVELLGLKVSRLEYRPTSAIDSYINGSPTNALIAYPIDSNGNQAGTSLELFSAGIASEVTTIIGGGKIKAALEMRDKILPDILSQLDNLAVNVRDAVNAIHNQGVSFPPPQVLNGTTLIDPKASYNWQGSVMIAALDVEGLPVKSPYPSDVLAGHGYTPLTINLESLSDSAITGKPSYQAIIDEINQYYGPPQPRVNIGAFSNVELVSRSDSMVAGSGTFNFALELTNLNVAASSSFRVMSAGISGGGTITSPATFPSASLAVPGGQIKSTDGAMDFGVDMSTAGPGPYTVTLNVESTDSKGVITTGQVTYTLYNAASAARNDRTAAVTATGDAILEAPTTTEPLLVAKLVDKNGVEVAKNIFGDYTGPGYLQISGGSSATRVGINEMNSSFQGDFTARPAVAPTSFGFSHQLGLNNFFVDTGKVGSAAVYMAVNAEISAKPERIVAGKMVLSNQPVTEGAIPRYTYEVSRGSNQIATGIAEVGTNANFFGPAGSLPGTTLTFSAYAAEILAFTSSRAATAEETVRQENLIQQGFIDRDKAIRGVNIDEEMANTIIFQNVYSANARVINVAKDLFDELLGITR